LVVSRGPKKKKCGNGSTDEDLQWILKLFRHKTLIDGKMGVSLLLNLLRVLTHLSTDPNNRQQIGELAVAAALTHTSNPNPKVERIFLHFSIF
jgi:hypothetical protein